MKLALSILPLLCATNVFAVRKGGNFGTLASTVDSNGDGIPDQQMSPSFITSDAAGQVSSAGGSTSSFGSVDRISPLSFTSQVFSMSDGSSGTFPSTQSVSGSAQRTNNAAGPVPVSGNQATGISSSGSFSQESSGSFITMSYDAYLRIVNIIRYLENVLGSTGQVLVSGPSAFSSVSSTRPTFVTGFQQPPILPMANILAFQPISTLSQPEASDSIQASRTFTGPNGFVGRTFAFCQPRGSCRVSVQGPAGSEVSSTGSSFQPTVATPIGPFAPSDIFTPSISSGLPETTDSIQASRAFIGPNGFVGRAFAFCQPRGSCRVSVQGPAGSEVSSTGSSFQPTVDTNLATPISSFAQSNIFPAIIPSGFNVNNNGVSQFGTRFGSPMSGTPVSNIVQISTGFGPTASQIRDSIQSAINQGPFQSGSFIDRLSSGQLGSRSGLVGGASFGRRKSSKSRGGTY